jgi:chromosome segregation ATPase
MEAKDIRTDKGDLNRWIRKTNDLLRKIKAKISELADWLKAADEELSNANRPSLAEILGDFYQTRNARAWSDKAKVGNLKQYAADIAFLETKGVTTVDDLHDFVSNTSDEYHSLNTSLKGKEARMKELKTLLRLAADYSRLKPIVDAIPAKGGFGKKREKYVAEHDSEIQQFYTVRRKLDNAVSDKKLTPKAWQAELDQLSQEYAAESAKLKPMWNDLKKLNDLQHRVDSTLREQQRSPQKQKNYEQEI